MRWWIGAALGIVSAATAAPRGAPAPPAAEAALTPESCGACHPDQLHTWQRSPHARSRTNPLFVASYARSRLRWCLDCHAPRPAPEAARAASIDCLTCHGDKGAILTAHAPSPAGEQAHPLRLSPGFATSAACERCHQFNAPVEMREPLRLSPTPMQDTVAEAGRAGGEPCQACHLARGTHDMEGGHDLARLQATVSVELAPTDGGFLAKLRARGAGHAVPTGDPFRRFELELIDPATHEVFARRRFGRTLADAADGGWLVSSTACPPSVQRDSLSPALFFATPEGGFAWELTYRMDEPGLDEILPESTYELDVASGRYR